MKKIILFLGSTFLAYALNLGEVPSSVVLDKANGADGQGKAWHSSSLKGKVHTLLYMDPDKREDNQLLLNALNKATYDAHTYSTVAIVNLAATWMPDAILESLLEKKQKELKNMIYVFDKKKFFVKKWHLKDEASNIFVLDKESKVIYAKTGRLYAKDVTEILKKIEDAK